MDTVTQPTIQPSVGAVNIQIYNPSVNPPGVQMPVQQVVSPQASAAQPINQQQTVTAPATAPIQPESKKEDAKKSDPPKPVVILSDDYIKLLDKYMNNKDADIRLSTIKEILKRFKEDSSRRSDPALTNLLNRALQDPSQGVRLIALAILKGNYASGNDLTLIILQKMKHPRNMYDMDANAASEILLDKAGQNLNVQSNQENMTQQQPAEANPQVGQKLNLVSQ